jgi:microcystin-dependent protein
VGTPFLGEIKLFSCNYAPQYWAFCNGQLLPINQNQALFSLLGTNYGGNGQTNFALPDLRGRVPIHVDGNHAIGQAGGAVAHTVSINEMPQHLHALNATSASGSTVVPTGALLAAARGQVYGDPKDLTDTRPSSIDPVGGSQAHTNEQPFLVLNFCIALIGAFPSQN